MDSTRKPRGIQPFWRSPILGTGTFGPWAFDVSVCCGRFRGCFANIFESCKKIRETIVLTGLLLFGGSPFATPATPCSPGGINQGNAWYPSKIRALGPIFQEPGHGASPVPPGDSQTPRNGVKWVRHNGGWSPVSLEALGRLCTGPASGPAEFLLGRAPKSEGEKTRGDY